MPGDPTTVTTAPWPSIDAVQQSSRRRTSPSADRPEPTRHARQPTPVDHAQQPMGAGTGSSAPLMRTSSGFAESRRALDQSRGRRAEHHPTRRGHRFHPLGHPDLLTNGGVTECTRTDLTGDHLDRS